MRLISRVSLRSYGWALPVIVLLGTISSLAEATGIGLFLPVLDTRYLDGSAGAGAPGGFRHLLANAVAMLPAQNRFSIMIGLIVIALLIKGALSYVTGVLAAAKNLQLSHEIRATMFYQFLNSGYAFAARSDWGRTLDALSTESWRATQTLSAGITVIINLCTVIVFGSFLLFLSWRLTLAVAIGMVLMSAAMRLISRPVARLGQDAVRLTGVLGERTLDGVIGIRTAEAYNLQPYLFERFSRASNNLRSTHLRSEFWSNLVYPCADISSSLLLLLLIALFSNLQGQLSILVVTVMMIYRLQTPFKQMEGARVTLVSLRGAADSVTEFLQSTAASRRGRRANSAPTPLKPLTNGITFDKVSFTYPGTTQPCLQSICATIPRGKMTAIVGASGAGKTTFLNLLCGFYQPTSGHILVDDVPLANLDPTEWRDSIAIAGQDVYLFNITVRENIHLGRLTASEADILQAARRADVDSFISELRDGYDTIVGDNGGKISGGQRQRIALARAFLRDPALLILDEATNALDGISERWVQSALSTLAEGRTVVVAAHRFSTIRDADHVIVLEQGQVVEQGSPADLQLLEGAFARLFPGSSTEATETA